MKAIRVSEYGDSGVLLYEDVPRPDLKPGQVLVEVYAASVNHLEIKMVSGKNKDSMPVHFPWIPGFDFAGRIDYVGKDVDGFQKGDQVFGKCSGGSYAEYIAVDQGTFALMPSNLSFSEAATVPHVGLTAWEAVYEHGKIEPGQKVLVQGASGAVGTFAVQFAKLAGGFIYAVDRGENRDYLESIGANVVIDYTQNDFTEIVRDVDLVLDFVGGDTPARSFNVMKRGGRLISTAAQLTGDEGEKYGVTAVAMGVKPDFEDLEEISRLIGEGKVKTDLAAVYPLSHAGKAWDVFNHKIKPEKEFTHGKIVLEVE